MLLRLSSAEAPPHLDAAVQDSAPAPQAAVTARPKAPRRGLLLQDISSNNLLLSQPVGQPCQLLFADPSRAQLTAHLDCLDVKDSWK